jgi:hypothetical protein
MHALCGMVGTTDPIAAMQAQAGDRGADGNAAEPLQDVSNGAHRMSSSAVAVRKQRAGGGSGAKRQSSGAKRSRGGGTIARDPSL